MGISPTTCINVQKVGIFKSSHFPLNWISNSYLIQNENKYSGNKPH